MRKLLAVLFCLGLVPARALYASEPDLEVGSELNKLAGLMSDGLAELNPEATVARPLKATHLHAAGVLALFTMESYQGRNDALQFMAFFAINDPKDSEPSDKPLHKYSLMGLTQVGEQGGRFFDSIAPAGDRVVLKGHAWTDKDPNCCPTGKVQSVFMFGPYGISEIKKAR